MDVVGNEAVDVEAKKASTAGSSPDTHLPVLFRSKKSPPYQQVGGEAGNRRLGTHQQVPEAGAAAGQYHCATPDGACTIKQTPPPAQER
ncbi:hypothetical protein FIBSPDRAFT_970235 [Athelia psychrophila]|uniref:Uncharacterized protein n=1 Tax=Athelia psychrophila TaxID=1759441 RepID=A0A167SU92_9AGAM|nr:hypothetical protein FIBSPDRAFT_970235 [Fibularhizoctonia sp. CBS 109695]